MRITIKLSLLICAFLFSNNLIAQVEVTADSTKKDSIYLVEMHFEIFKDSTWGKGGLNTRMTKTNVADGRKARVFQSIDRVVEGDLICEFMNADATIIVREVLKNPLLQGQDSAPFRLQIQSDMPAFKVEIRRVRKDNKTEKLGSFKLKR